MKSKLLTGMALLTIMIVATSCKDDVTFDPDSYNRLAKASFVVENSDPSHDWATVGSTQVNVAVNGDYGTTYDVGIYLDNPIGAEQATLLYETQVVGSGTISCTVSHPKNQTTLYVGMFDQDGRGMAQVVEIANGVASAVVGGNTASARRAQENAKTYPDYVRTFNNYLNPSLDDIKAVIKMDNSIAWKADNMSVAPEVTVDDMKAYTAITNDIIANETSNGNHTLSDKSYYYTPEDYPGHGDGKHYRVAAGTEITEVFHINATENVVNDAVIYVEGKLHLNGNTLNGPTIVVADGGEVVIDGNTDMSNAGRILIMHGGKLTASKSGVSYNVNNGGACYNGGTIDFDGTLNVNGCNFYNASGATVNVDVLRNTSGGRFTNFGSIEARTNTLQGDAHNSVIVNGCYMLFRGNAGVGSITMLDNSRLDVGGQLYITGKEQWGSGQNNVMYNLSEISAGSIYWRGAKIQGPSATGQYAVVKCHGKHYIDEGGSLESDGFVYFDINTDSLCNYQGVPWIETVSRAEDFQYTAAGWVLAHNIHYYIDEETALESFTIPAGECTGAGFNPQGNSGGGKPKPNHFSMRWCFEDNFPDFGDYDFNDVVLTVTPTVIGDTLRIHVRLDAVGATKNIGAGLRLDGINSSMLKDYYAEKEFAAMPAAWRNIDNINNNGKTILREKEECNNTDDMVVVFFKNAHWAINPVEDPNGGAKVAFYNTVKTDNANRNKKYVTSKEAIYTFIFNSADKAKDMASQEFYDVFIVEPFNGSYWEVHTVQNGFKAEQVVTPVKPEGANGINYDWYATNPETGHLPWAIMVPGNFQYPIEWTPIGRNSSDGTTGAYHEPTHSFPEWASNMQQATDWYEYPDAEYVFDFNGVTPRVTD